MPHPFVLSSRVQKTISGSNFDYVYDLAGNVVAEANASGWMTGYVYLNGGLLAQYFNGTTYFVLKDHLGSTRLLTGVNQSIVQNLDYLPFGELNSADSGVTSHKFTSKERDSESGLDNFTARYDASSLGRFMTPDWNALPAPVPFSDLTNPQSLNLYAYVRNNPLSLIDPDGHDCAYCQRS